MILSQVATLNKATAYIFTDMQTAERHQHALDCYSTTSKRCGALLQWINMVRTSVSSVSLLTRSTVRWFTAPSKLTWRISTLKFTRLQLI